MAVYDQETEKENELTPGADERPKKSPTPEEIAQRESEIGDSYNKPGGEFKRRLDQATGRHSKTRNAGLAGDAEEAAALKDKIRGTYADARQADEDAGFFKPEGSKKGIRGRLKGLRKNKKTAIIGGGLIGIVLAGGFGLFSILNTFRLDHILNTLDQQTFSRFNASFDRRSDAWFRSYLRLRLMEWDGNFGANGENNLYFRSNKVDNDNPVRDWYRTMRTSSFEKDLFEKDGIKFTSMISSDGGRIQTGLITIKDKPISFDIINQQGVDINLLANGDLNQLNKVGPQVDDLIDTKVFGSDKEARRAIKAAVNDNTRSYQVFRRRHMRKDIANMTGVREWRLFEKTRDKITNAKIEIQRKIINKVFSGDSSSMRFLNCLLGGSGCPKTSDPVDPENGVRVTPTGELDAPDERTGELYDNDTGEPKPPDGDGNILKGSSDEIADEVSDVITKELSEEVGDATGTLSERILKSLAETVSKLAGGPAAVVTWAQRLAAIDRLFGGGADSTIIKLVKNARMAQLVGFYAATSIARDQIKSGELVGDELNGFYEMTNNFGNSEAWSAVGASYSSSQVSAQSSENVAKEVYCKSDYDRKFDQYAWYCDSFKPNGGSTGENIAATYEKSIGWLIGPIADAINGIKSIPIVGPLISKFASIFNSIVGAITSVFGDAAMAGLRVLGLEDNLQNLIGTAMGWLLNFVGASPFVDPGEPGFAAWLVGGSAGTAETSTRSSGGVSSTETTYKYSKEIAAEYEKERMSNMSWSERYFSPENPKSIVSNVAFSISNVTSGENLLQKAIGSFTSLPQSLMGRFSRNASAANKDLAILAGVDMYDIPQQCIDLDPLDEDYLIKATNAKIPNLSYAILTNSDTFWQAVYSNDQFPNDREQIYNCGLLDTRIRGSLGYLYGYSDDGGLDNGTATAPTTQAGTGIVGDPFTESASIGCAEGTTDLGTNQKAYNDGVEVPTRLCAVPNIPSSSQESTPGSEFYVEGANGKVIVNSRVSGAVYSMALAASADGVPLIASSSYRTMEHQQRLWDANPNPLYVARPGNSNHQSGTAIDFNAGGVKGGRTCANRARAPDNAIWNWLFSNAENYGYTQYSAESWHWDPSVSSNKCDSSQ